MVFKFFFSVLIVFVCHLFAINVEFYDEQCNNESNTTIRIRVVNDSKETIKNVKLRYYFHSVENKNVVIDSYYIVNAEILWKELNSSLSYLDVKIDSIPPGVYPNASGFSIGLHYSDWSVWNKAADYSYQKNSVYAENSKILIFQGDSLIYGVIPADKVENRDFAITGFRPMNLGWIEIENISDSSRSTDGLTLMDSKANLYKLGSVELKPKEKIKFCQNYEACAISKSDVIDSSFLWGENGEAVLMKDSLILSYISWGIEGAFAEKAVAVDVWDNKEDFFPSTEIDSIYGIEYEKNVYFKTKPFAKITNTDGWWYYTSNDSLKEEQSSPSPILLSTNKEKTYRMKGDDSISFNWQQVRDVSSYQLIVLLEKDSSLIERMTTNKTSLKLKMPAKKILWGVSPAIKEKDGTEFFNRIDRFVSTEIEDVSINGDVHNEISVNSIPARKDTKLLDLSWGKDILKNKWDQSHLNALTLDEDENKRCGVIGIQLLNKYYGGTLTQDEIKFYVGFSVNEPLLSPFKHLGLLTEELNKGLKWALNTEKLNYNLGSPSYDVVKKAIDGGRLILVTIPGHVMVIYGYVGEADAYYYEYANGDNNGHPTSSLGNTSKISDYWIPEVTGKARNSDARISIDSDSDGLVNFDEEVRFGTDPYSFDSDNDGIDDKTEIFSYTHKIAKKNVSKYIQEKADYDNDGIRAEKDPDSDGGGVIDGLEDFNSNGLYDKGESIVLDERDDVRDLPILDIPDDYTFYALGSLRINNGVKCYNRIDEDKPSCKVASFESSLLRNFFPNKYSLILGARSSIGSADSRGTVFIRSGAHVYGNLNIYVMANSAAFYEISGASLNLNDFLTSQESSVIYGSSSLQYVGDWPNSYSFSLPDKINGKGKIVVKAGETFYLRDDFACDTLKVENGATLVVEPGEMYVDSLLLLEANSRIEFSQPGVSSVLHIAGNCIWRPYRSEPITDLNYWTSVAKGFKMIQHSSKRLFIEGPWGGTIYAPLSELILGQATKTLYGRFLGKKITVHQYTKVFRVDFVSNISLEVAQLKRGSEK